MEGQIKSVMGIACQRARILLILIFIVHINFFNTENSLKSKSTYLDVFVPTYCHLSHRYFPPPYERVNTLRVATLTLLYILALLQITG